MPITFDCERRRAAVPRDLPLDGLSLGEIGRLSAEGAYQLTENTMMDEKWMGVVRHVVNTAGAFMMAVGFMDEAMWAQVSGALMVLIPMAWSWKAKA